MPSVLICVDLWHAGGLDTKRKHFIEGGQAGNREQYINNLVRVMN